MLAEGNATSRRGTFMFWGFYLAKSIALLALLYMLACFSPSFSPLLVAIFWAALSAFLALSFAYHHVVKKLHRQLTLEEEGAVAAVNSGRLLCLAMAFIASAVMMAGLMLEAPKWGLSEWGIVFAAAPVYGAVYALMRRFSEKNWKAPFRVSATALLSCAATGMLLCAAYAAVCSVEPTAIYVNAAEAFAAVRQPFELSPSALLAETGKLAALADGLTVYGMSEAARSSIGVYAVWRALLCGSALFGISFLLGACTLGLRDFRLVFLPLDAAGDPDRKGRPERKFIYFACALPIALTACFLVADWKASEAVEAEEYTLFEEVVRKHVGLAVCMIDGRLYDQLAVQDLIEGARAASSDLALECETALVPLINEAHDKRLENVDSYLDWYYSLPAEYDRLVQYFTGTVESGMRDQLSRKINDGVDDSELAERFEYYLRQSKAIEDSLLAALGQYEIDSSVPQWLIVSTEAFDSNFLSEPFAPTRSILDASERMGLSAASGAIAGLVAKNTVEKALAKPFFGKMLEKTLAKLAARGLLAEGGTLIAPGVGTAVGLGVGAAVDFLSLKVDELANRDDYREELMGAIEESREEMLALVQSS